MSATLFRDSTRTIERILTRPPASATTVEPAFRRGGHRRRKGARGGLARRVSPGSVLGAVLVLIALSAVAWVTARNLYAAPMRFDDEGTYVDQARSLVRDGDLSPYTYWYDHPPLGWILLAGWLVGPSHLWDAPDLIGSGRQLMLVVTVAAALLVYVLGRRLGLSRPAGAAAVLLFGLSPLAVTFHRMVLLDNLAVLLVLAAFVLALSPGRRLMAALGSGAALAGAVLTKETALLMAPFVLWLLLRTVVPATRRMSLVVFGIGFGLLAVLYPLYALLKTELVPAPDRVSLWQGIAFQLFERKSSGSVFDPGSDAYGVVTGWLDMDAVLPVAGLLAAVAALAVRRIRPLAAAMLLLAAMLLRPGYLPVPYVVAMLPLAALLIAGVADSVLRRFPVRDLARRQLRGSQLVGALLVPVIAAAALALVAERVVPGWRAGDSILMTRDEDRPYRQASAWVERHVGKDEVLLVDNVTRTDLVEAGYPSDHVVWFTKLDVDPAVEKKHPSWRSYDYVVSSSVMRTAVQAGPSLGTALERSKPVATFGHGEHRVVVLKVRTK
jgi:4-amino-4-deoxy-L-arabinose transferase-like glycosyltransferase